MKGTGNLDEGKEPQNDKSVPEHYATPISFFEFYVLAEQMNTLHWYLRVQRR